MSVRKGLIFSSLERYGVLLLGLATTLITARLLTPADFGVAIIGLAVFGLIDIFREFGGATYIIQVDNPTPDRVQTVFTFNVLLALPLFLGLFFFASAIADFYGTPGLKSYLHVSAWCLLLTSFSSPVYALLCRDLQFGRLTTLSLATTVLNFILTITLALLGFSYMSFAWAQLLSSVVYFALCLAWRPKFPIYRLSLAEWRVVASYGMYDSARGMLMHLNDSAPLLAFGKTIGAEAVGIFNRAITVSRLPERTVLAGLAPVLQPAFSKHVREGQNLKRSFLMGVEQVTALLWPALICIALLAKPLITILLGAQWGATVPIAQIVAMASFASFLLTLARPALIAVGAVRDTAIFAVLTVPIVVGIQILASFYGLHAAAWGFLVTNLYAALVALIIVRRRIPFSWNEFAASVSKSAVVTLIVAIPCLLTAWWAGGLNRISIFEGVGAAAIAAGVWLLAIYWVRHPITQEISRAINYFLVRTDRALPSNWRTSKM
ncbi:MAG: lipopolysaccharide biosynthesis protein [Hyphomicrobium sp.]